MVVLSAVGFVMKDGTVGDRTIVSFPCMDSSSCICGIGGGCLFRRCFRWEVPSMIHNETSTTIAIHTDIHMIVTIDMEPFDDSGCSSMDISLPSLSSLSSLVVSYGSV